jgi:hypothetical protein
MHGGPVRITAMQDDRADRFGQQDRGHQAGVDLTQCILPEGGLHPGLFGRRNDAAQFCGVPGRVLADQYIMERPKRHGTPVVRHDMQHTALQCRGHHRGRWGRHSLQRAHSGA